MSPRWTRYDDTRLRALHIEGHSCSEIAGIINRSTKSVEGRVRTLRLSGTGFPRTFWGQGGKAIPELRRTLPERIAERDRRFAVVAPLDHVLMGTPLPGYSALDQRQSDDRTNRSHSQDHPES